VQVSAGLISSVPDRLLYAALGWDKLGRKQLISQKERKETDHEKKHVHKGIDNFLGNTFYRLCDAAIQTHTI
jgi:hypothetical protein